MNAISTQFPELPTPAAVLERTWRATWFVGESKLDHGIEQHVVYTADQMHQYARDYAASQTAGVPDGWKLMPELPKPQVMAGYHSMPTYYTSAQLRAYGQACYEAGLNAGRHPDALPDGTLSKSTVKRIAALDASASVSERARGYHQHDAIEFAVRDLGYSPADAARITAAIEQALTQQRWHGTTGSMEQAEKATFVPCDCGCGRSCCAMCGNDVGFLTHQPSADAVRELVRRWRELSVKSHRDGQYQGYDTLRLCADELESLLSAASGEKGVG